MDQIYSQADAILTKPGGVTISEVIQKKLPILIHSALPGQEEINLNFLINNGLALNSSPEQLFNSQLANEQDMSTIIKKIEKYQENITDSIEEALTNVIKIST